MEEGRFKKIKFQSIDRQSDAAAEMIFMDFGNQCDLGNVKLLFMFITKIIIIIINSLKMFHSRQNINEHKNHKIYAMLRKDNRENKENQNNNMEVQQKVHNKNRSKENNILMEQNYSSLISQHSSISSKVGWEDQVKNTFTNIIQEHYSDDIFTHLVSQNNKNDQFLEKHEITSYLRAKMIDWMIEVLSSYKMSQNSFFRSVQLMDTYFQRCQKKLMISDLHLIGVASMYSATKYEQIYPLKINALTDKICRKKFRKNQILQYEANILMAMNFELQKPTLLDIVEHLIVQFPLKFEERLKTFFKDVTLYLSKLTFYSYETSQMNLQELAGAVIYLGLKTVEQHENIVAENYFDFIVEKCDISSQLLLKVSEKMLEFAKKFKTEYPNLLNLKKFNPIQY